MDRDHLDILERISKAGSSRRSSGIVADGTDTQMNHGLSTQEALVRLHNDACLEVSSMEEEFSKKKFSYWLRESISFKSELSKMRWPSVVFMLAHVLVHFIVGFVLKVGNHATDWVVFQGFVLASLLFFNLVVNFWDTKLRFKELLLKSKQILQLVKQCSQDKYLLKRWQRHSWSSASAKSLFVPRSPCVHQTLTYRDESCCNLPDYLLVKGDIIHLFPGDRAPGECISLTRAGDNHNGHYARKKQIVKLKEGQIFHGIDCKSSQSYMDDYDPPKRETNKKHSPNQPSHAKLTRANKGSDFLMLSTPYVTSLRLSLQRSHKRPVNSIEKECFIVSRKYFETFVIPSVFLLSTVVTAIHYGYLDLTDSDQQIKTISIAHLLMRPSLTIMPFLPWMFPCFWLAINAYGSARLICCAETQRKKLRPQTATGNSDDARVEQTKVENLLATPTVAGSSENKHGDDELNELRSEIEFSKIFKVFTSLIRGESGHLWRSSSLLQVLGCLTSFCCIDKVGILSWPNPTPEKVFFMTKNSQESAIANTQSSDVDNESDYPHDESVPLRESPQTLIQINQDNNSNSDIQSDAGHHSPDLVDASSIQIHQKPKVPSGKAEILDVSLCHSIYRGPNARGLTTSQLNRLQFDDLNWAKYLDCLKPLGLAILLNNCCDASFGDYFRFYRHISHRSILACNLTPVVKRRCICNLSRLIGFSKDAIKNYRYSNQVGIYKFIDPCSATKSKKLAQSLENSTRLKLPFSNMVCNIHQDALTSGYQVFSQGTADIILDTCVEYWNGSQLVTLDDADKKKIMDFYHRSSLTSYCSAFSYTPLSRSHKFKNRYIELPFESSASSPNYKKLMRARQEELLQNQQFSKSLRYKLDNPVPPQEIISSDELNDVSVTLSKEPKFNANNLANFELTPRRHLSLDEIVKWPDTDAKSHHREFRSKSKTRKLDRALNELADQVFVGMVAMQYQACPDFVALVEQLEHACIRFVHFSKENELRSRVFSEKMGLESGWNCHISLQSDQDLDNADRNEASNFSAFIKEKHRDEANQESAKFRPTSRISNILAGPDSEKKSRKTGEGNESQSEDERTLYSWKSLPSIIMNLAAKMSDFREQNPHCGTCLACKNGSGLCDLNVAAASECGDEETETQQIETADGEATLETIAFDMSNRAKLPKGIEKIRPHLETVDNIPLQVSLFTDCTTELTREMIEIMQDFGEIVCVVGSSSSRSNTSIFLQANASIAIEPFVPECCTYSGPASSSRSRASKIQDKSKRKRNPRQLLKNAAKSRERRERLESRRMSADDDAKVDEVSSSSSSSSSASSRSTSSSSSSSSSDCSSDNESRDFNSEPSENGATEYNIELSSEEDSSISHSLVQELPVPSALASKLASLPCTYSYSRREPVNLYSLILEARHFTFKMKNTFVCMICFALSVSCAQFLASVLFLPPMLSSGLTIWLTVVVVPLISFSLMDTTMDPQVMKMAVGKNLQLKPENITFFVICYLIKFIPSVIVVVLNFGLIISHSCKLTGFGSSSLGPCWMFTYVQHGNSTAAEIDDGDLLWSTHLLTAQVCAAFLLVLYLIVISSGFVHRSHLIWQRSPTRNSFWVIISFSLLVAQFLCSQLILKSTLGSSTIPNEFLLSLPFHIWIISLTWPILMIAINLLVKRAEIKATVRQQRRARFDFNTKLGMNSPF